MKSFCTSTTTRRSRSPGLALACALALPPCPISPPATRPAAPARNSRRLKFVMGHLLGAGSIADAAWWGRGRTVAARALCDNPETECSDPRDAEEDNAQGQEIAGGHTGRRRERPAGLDRGRAGAGRSRRRGLSHLAQARRQSGLPLP